jgi:hypothetical protein
VSDLRHREGWTILKIWSDPGSGKYWHTSETLPTSAVPASRKPFASRREGDTLIQSTANPHDRYHDAIGHWVVIVGVAAALNAFNRSASVCALTQDP